ncbi:DNase I-like protein [Basidiobolus meristosporus CBS 931.73]|uniref:DNase I-like protein n=1 Tax=Basidiobolus meristosporus CBS 931.73 TaxID=1314790 RepID=A0A1Y1Y579_9FUNG|nr:DNase I-like protein [Basidiobolus meristosporus CBS 931.73]|eukprot:ORX93157.1 DNase I-like protein [Basidiobolus meristosporus CBS 931.73]
MTSLWNGVRVAIETTASILSPSLTPKSNPSVLNDTDSCDGDLENSSGSDKSSLTHSSCESERGNTDTETDDTDQSLHNDSEQGKRTSFERTSIRGKFGKYYRGSFGSQSFGELPQQPNLSDSSWNEEEEIWRVQVKQGKDQKNPPLAQKKACRLVYIDRRPSLPAPRGTRRRHFSMNDDAGIDLDTESASFRHSTLPRSVKSFLTVMGSVFKHKNRSADRYSTLFDASDEAPDKNSLKIFCGTWNMYGKPPPKNLDPFIEKPTQETPSVTPYLSHQTGHPYHFLVIGTQECQRPISESVLFPSKEEWERQLVKLLSPQYVLVKSETMAALHLAVFVWRDCRHWIKGMVDSLQEPIRPLVTIHIRMLSHSLGSGSDSHFTEIVRTPTNNPPAHQGKVADRNYDYKRIDKELRLNGYKTYPPGQKPVTVSDRFDYTFWVGDLNYRVEGDRRTIDAKLSSGDYGYLLDRDQLTQEREKGTVFPNFEEAPITFPPTYKFDVPHTGQTFMSSESSLSDSMPPSLRHIYDSSPKARIPSWTDRILYKSLTGEIDVLRYEGLMEMYGSDHKPVVGVFSIRFNWKKELITELQSYVEQGTVVQTIEQQRDLMLAKLAKENNSICRMQ